MRSDASVAGWIRKMVPARFRPIGYLEHLVRIRTDGRVHAGPFAGMRYVHGSIGSAYVPKLLGIYERELAACIEQACTLNLPLIVDIGAAEGYYAIGLALRNPGARVIAFEMEQKGRTALKEMVKLNDVSLRVEVRDRCNPHNLAQLLVNAGSALILCDAEGDEDALLNPVAIPALTHAHVLVETHDFVLRGVTERLVERFRSSHNVNQIWQESRARHEMPYRTLGTALLPKRYLDWAVSEWRPERMCWLWMEPRIQNGGA